MSCVFFMYSITVIYWSVYCGNIIIKNRSTSTSVVLVVVLKFCLSILRWWYENTKFLPIKIYDKIEKNKHLENDFQRQTENKNIQKYLDDTSASSSSCPKITHTHTHTHTHWQTHTARKLPALHSPDWRVGCVVMAIYPIILCWPAARHFHSLCNPQSCPAHVAVHCGMSDLIYSTGRVRVCVRVCVFRVTVVLLFQCLYPADYSVDGGSNTFLDSAGSRVTAHLSPHLSVCLSACLTHTIAHSDVSLCKL